MASDASDASDASHASDAIDYIQTLIQKGFAYELDRYVVFDWTAFAAVSTTKYPAPAPVRRGTFRCGHRTRADVRRLGETVVSQRTSHT